MSGLAQPRQTLHFVDMHFVYILRSEDHQHWYTGITTDLTRRIAEHNAGKSRHTSARATHWQLHTFIGFFDEYRAQRFEEYLKTHSGRAFAKKRL
jgi:predicted GIY-YIG superfamily endonuclease